MAAETGQLKKREFGPANPEAEKVASSADAGDKPTEEKPKSKFPQPARPLGGQNALIQKRLGKGQKFFDSGDYQMYKQRGVTAEVREGVTAEVREGVTAEVREGVTAEGAKKLPPTLPSVLAQPTGEEIPRPDTVPTRKTSIITQPKFSPPTTTDVVEDA
ncbi:unnamed protein product [Cyprideis torosa]|uniref:Uncharacterized protein n=1 Tax=Cyprideis torosa TaxID=163714 RepID=A0A7R8WEN5_9CRUS|nr:unnamed protein product [Cyprideis torosa]CAG0896001.1 unnamed protein product [Cyprideis torosa]